MAQSTIDKFVDGWNRGWRLGTDITGRRKLIADRLRMARMQAGLKQKELAEKIDLNPTTYSGYENGVGNPSVEALVRIADLYQISLDYLTGRTDNQYGIQSPNKEPELLAPSNLELVQRIEKLEEIISTQNMGKE